MFRRTMDYLSTHRMLKAVPIVIVVETQAGLEGSTFEEMARDYGPRVLVMKEIKKVGYPGSFRFGVLKAPAEDMSFMFGVSLNQGTIYYSSDMFVYGAGRTASAMSRHLENQMYNYQKKVDAKGRMRLDGKGSGGQNDDLLITTMMLTWWHQSFLASRDPYYLNWRRTFVPITPATT